MKNKNERRFSMEDKFMKNKKINDVLYGYLQSVSYLDKNDTRFVYKDKINFLEIERQIGGTIKHKTLSRNFNFLLQTGFVVKGRVHVNGNSEETVSAYILPYNHNSMFQMVDINTLDYLIRGTNTNVIKVYIYLLDKYKWKLKENSKYVFTKKELLQTIGSSTTNKRDYDKLNTIIIDILLKLKLIEIEQFYCENKQGKPTPKIRLLKANEKVEISRY